MTIRLTLEQDAKLREEAAKLFPRQSDDEQGIVSKVVVLALEEHWKARPRATVEARIGSQFARFSGQTLEFLKLIGEWKEREQ